MGNEGDVPVVYDTTSNRNVLWFSVVSVTSDSLTVGHNNSPCVGYASVCPGTVKTQNGEFEVLLFGVRTTTSCQHFHVPYFRSLLGSPFVFFFSCKRTSACKDPW